MMSANVANYEPTPILKYKKMNVYLRKVDSDFDASIILKQ